MNTLTLPLAVPLAMPPAQGVDAARRRRAAPQTLARCLLLALLLHVWLLLLLGTAPGGTAEPGQGVWGAINVRLRGLPGPDAAVAPQPQAPVLPGGAPGPAAVPRWGGTVRDASPAAATEPGAAQLGTWAETPAQRGAEPAAVVPAPAADNSGQPGPLPTPPLPTAVPAPAAEDTPPPLRTTTAPAALSPALPALPAVPAVAAAADPVAPVPPAPLLAPAPAPPVQRSLPARLPSQPTRRLDSQPIDMVAPLPLTPLPPQAALPVPVPVSTPPLPQPTPPPAIAPPQAPQQPAAQPAPAALQPPADAVPSALPSALPSARPSALPPAPVPVPAIAPASATAPVPADEAPAPAVRRLSPPAAAATTPTPMAPLPRDAVAPALPLPPIPALPGIAIPGAGAGAPDAGERTGHDVATPPGPAASAPLRLNLQLQRPRGAELSRGGASGLLPVLPRPPELPDKLAKDIEKAGKADCRTAYSGAGLLAVVPLAVDAVRKDGCKW